MNAAQQHVSDEFLKCREALMKFAVTLCRDRDRAEDLFHDTYLRAVLKADLYEPGTKLVAWATVLMRNYFISQGRLLKNRTHCELTVEDLPTLPATQADRLQLREAVRSMAKLRAEERQAILLVGVEGLTQDQAAVVQGVAVGTVKSRMSRGRDILRATTR